MSASFWTPRLPAIALLAMTSLLAAAPLAAQTRIQKLRLTPPSETAGFAWTELAKDDQGDIQTPGLPDAKALSYHYDAKNDVLWLKIDLYEPFAKSWFGINVAVDSDRDQTTGMNWWGLNQKFRFDRLLTVWVSDVGKYYQGTVGVADVDGLNAGKMDNLASGGIRVSRGPGDTSLIVGVERRALAGERTFDLICTVGSTLLGNDDLPNTRWVHLELPHPSG